MLSRVAENFYWMARYLERAENTARIINVNSHLLLDTPTRVELGWEPIVRILGTRDYFLSLYSQADERSVVSFLIGDANNTGSILASLYLARENARTVRDVMPREGWEQVNDLYLAAKTNLQKGLSKRHRFAYLQSVIRGNQTVNGLLGGAMTRHQGYSFLRMGRFIERADMTTRIIDVRSASLLQGVEGVLAPFENIQWVSVLKSLSAYQMYRQTVNVRVHRDDVLRFLFRDPNFPRAFYHSLLSLESCLKDLPRHRKPLRTLAAIRRQVTHRDPSTLEQEELHTLIDELQLGLGNLHDTITATYFRFSHTGRDSRRSGSPPQGHPKSAKRRPSPGKAGPSSRFVAQTASQ